MFPPMCSMLQMKLESQFALNNLLLLKHCFDFCCNRLGSDEGSVLLSWSTLNPNKLVRQFRKFKDHFNFKSFEEFMKRVSRTSL